MKQTLCQILPLTLGILWLFTLIPSSAIGLSSNRVGLRPGNTESDYTHSGGWLVYEVDPAKVTEIKDTTKIMNLSDNQVVVKLEAVDAILAGGGGFALLDNKSENENLGSWVTLEETTITLPPQSDKLVHFTITIPKNAEVGDHIGGLTIQEIDSPADSTLKSGGTSVRVRTRVGLRVYLTLLGDIERNFKIRDRKFYGVGDKMMIQTTVENLGNIRTDMRMDARIYGIFGRYDTADNVNFGQTFPKKTVTYNISWPGKKDRPLFGPYLAIMTFRDAYEPMSKTVAMPPAPKPVTTWAVTFFIPYTQTIVVLILAFLVWFFMQLRRWRKTVALARMRVVAYKIKKGDHLMDIAAHYEIGWKFLAQLNDIKPPYSLHGLTTLYVPDARGKLRDIASPQFWGSLFAPIIGWLKKIFKRTKPYFTIVIDKGDTKKSVEQFTNLTWTELMRYNHLASTTRPKAGMELKVPRRRRQR